MPNTEQPERRRPVRSDAARSEQDYNVGARLGTSREDLMDDDFVSAALMEAYNGPDFEKLESPEDFS